MTVDQRCSVRVGSLGARLAVSEAEAETIYCLIVAGDDFPASVVQQVEGWGVTVYLQETAGSPSARGLLRYEGDVSGGSHVRVVRNAGHIRGAGLMAASGKTFQHTSPPLRPRLNELPGHLLRSPVIHTLASPTALTEQAGELEGLRGVSAPKPLIAWEPSPLHCDHKSRDTGFLGAFRRRPPRRRPVSQRRRAHEHVRPSTAPSGPFAQVRAGARRSPRERGWVKVVRCGRDGCLTVLRRGGPVAAGLMIEQVGPPRREVVDGRELWKGEGLDARLEKYKAKAGAWDTGLLDPSGFVYTYGWPERGRLFE